MTFATDITNRANALVALVGADVEPHDLAERVTHLSDADAVAVAEAAAALMRCAELAQVAAVGVIAARSARDAGHSGIAQRRGHRTAVSFVQELTGCGKTDAARKVRVGESLLAVHEAATSADVGTTTDVDPRAGAGTGADVEGATDVEARTAQSAPAAWDAPLSAALLAQTITAAQHDAIRQGLGAPPEEGVGSGAGAGAEPGAGAGPDEGAGAGADPGAGASPDEAGAGGAAGAGAGAGTAAAAAAAAWSSAAEQLIAHADACSLEELRGSARAMRDRLDPEGAHRRFLERHERRSFRLWTDADGNRRGSFLFDDEGGLLAQTVLDSALRPRRGGPRFVDSAEKERAAQLTDDRRSNDQLAYDLFVDILRAGAFADAETVFGTRQAGVRLVQVVNTETARTEDGLTVLPAAAAEQHICDSGIVPVTVDSRGNPLDVGREARLFTPRQRIGLAIRDGGCMWPGCERPASYCEAHHIDEWHRDRGRTDIDRGILLCRFHHMNLHHHRWRITRDGTEDFVLHPPPGRSTTPTPLRRKPALGYAWAAIGPPQRPLGQPLTIPG